MVGWFAATSRFPEEIVGSYVGMLTAVVEWPLNTRGPHRYYFWGQLLFWYGKQYIL
jgi:hypothetical protein